MYKKKYTLEQRQSDSSTITKRYPYRVPCIVESYAKQTKHVSQQFKNKYLVPKDLAMGQFSYIVGKRLNEIDTDVPEKKAIKAIFLFNNDRLVPTSTTLGQLYSSDKDEDGFLYFVYSYENTFGYNIVGVKNQ